MTMDVTYEKFRKFKKRNKKKMKCKAGISRNILARMGRNGYISMESVEKVCRVLYCR